MVIRTGDMPVEERSGSAREVIEGTVVPVKVRSVLYGDAEARLRGVEVGGIQVSILDYPPMEVHRTPQLIRQSDPQAYVLGFNINGPVDILCGDQSVRLDSGDMTLHDTSRPFSIYTRHGRGMIVLIPRRLLPLPQSRVRQLLMARMSCREGISALAVDYLQDLVRNADSYRPGDTTRLVTITLDLITTMLARELDHGRPPPPETGRQALLAQIHAYIGRHLADHELSPEAIAAAHHISVRSLHRLFRAQDTTVMAWIRARRLDHSRRDLADPRLRDRPIHSIAARWGFTAPHFTRIFHTTYGVKPQDFRIQQLSPQQTLIAPGGTAAPTRPGGEIIEL